MVSVTEFSAGLAWVKAETLSGSGRDSRVRSNNWVKPFSLSGGGRVRFELRLG
jgi:hypothetical protein